MQLYLRYDKPAENSDKGWEEYSIPLGNGYMGANVFGGVECERIQITENSLVNPGERTETSPRLGGLTNFGEVYIKFPHDEVTEYERGLCLDNATAYTKYNYKGITYHREYFTSYPDKVLVVKLSCSKAQALSFELCPEIPFVKDYAITPGDGAGKTGELTVQDDIVTMRGVLTYFHVLYEGQVKVITDGEMISGTDSIKVQGANEAIILMAVGTNYKLCSEVFTTEDPTRKTLGEDPHEKVTQRIKDASALSYEELLEHHCEDFTSFFGRVSLDLGEDDSKRLTEELLKEYRQGKRSKYLETVYFQYGRYLLISASRKGCLPANLQGIWNCHNNSPWGSGYWHNINVQMNYWPAFNTNLPEMFEAYADYFHAFYDAAAECAEEYIQKHNPENYREGECGWTIGTAAFPYHISSPGRHSGPGTGGLTTKLFWDYYEVTQDKEILEKVSYKALKGMSDFLTKTIREYDGEYLVSYSASPEQPRDGVYYHTVGCAFDQQLMYENGKDFIKASEILGKDSETLRVQKQQMEHYHPVRIGWSGQIKEFLEEKFYGEIGEKNHRHISHLMALYPGTQINSMTPAWMDAAKFALTARGDKSTGWALAHRLNAWARTGDGNHAYKLLVELLSNKTNPNLWDEHPPFQIDGNFGATAGVAEMLLQSHEGFLSILPALPDSWEKGKVKGLSARGGFDVNIEWDKCTPKTVVILSKAGTCLKIKAAAGEQLKITCNGMDIPTTAENGIVSIETQKNMEYIITGFVEKVKHPAPSNLQVNDSLILTWEGGPCDIYRAVDEAPVYECVARNVESPYQDDYDFGKAEILTYKVAVGEEGVTYTLNHATEVEKVIYEYTMNDKVL